MLSKSNPEVHMETIEHRLEGAALDQAVSAVDLVMDCCDNFATRHDITRACVKYGQPLVSGAAIRFAGQVRRSEERRVGKKSVSTSRNRRSQENSKPKKTNKNKKKHN